MTWQSAEAIADALLYEGYLLYPYRGSAVKNRYRWQFGILAPRGWDTHGGTEPSLMQTECLLEGTAETTLAVKVRFLQVEARRVERRSGDDAWQPVDSLYVDGRELVSWDEAVPGELVLPALRVGRDEASDTHAFEVSGGSEVEPVRDASGEVAARIVRERWPLSCAVHVDIDGGAAAFRKVRVRIENHTAWPPPGPTDRPAALRRSLIATHTLLAARDGAFVSLLEPPDEATAAVAGCRNLHTWPVLVGEAPRRDLLLSSPIILYDYPAVAPESAGDMFDATEIDELLTLRLRTLTAEEQRQALATDPRAAQLIERAASLPTEQLERLHGAVRYFGEATRGAPEPAALEAWLNPPGSDAAEALDGAGRPIRKGSRVRLRPERRADAMDMFLAEHTATVAAVYKDLEDQAHVAVTVEAARAGDLHEAVGRYYYFRPDEVEVVEAADPRVTATSAPVARVLVAGIGNVFLGDDGFGSAVAQRLATRALPDGVRVEDFGIRSVHLAYDLLDAEYDATILIDAVSRGGTPGTLYVIEPEPDEAAHAVHDAHAMSVESVLAFLKNIGGRPGRVLVVGCEAASLDPGMGLSDAVAAAVAGAADLVAELVGDLFASARE